MPTSLYMYLEAQNIHILVKPNLSYVQTRSIVKTRIIFVDLRFKGMKIVGFGEDRVRMGFQFLEVIGLNDLMNEFVLIRFIRKPFEREGNFRNSLFLS